MTLIGQRSMVRMDSLKSSVDHVDGHERRLETEIEQLCVDIRRIGPTFPEPEPRVLFGELFDDEQVEQYYEALVGTLKSAKKRGLISFKGQMLLKGAHDNVVISLVGEDLEKQEESIKASAKLPIKESKSVSKPQPVTASEPASAPKTVPASKSASAPKTISITKPVSSNANTPQFSSNFSRLKNLNINQNSKPIFPSYNPYKSQSSASQKQYTSSTYSRSSYLQRSYSYSYKSTGPPQSVTVQTTKSPSPNVRRSNPISSATVPIPESSLSTQPPSVISIPSPKSSIVRSTTFPSRFARTEQADRIEKEIPQLLKDIRRIGTPGEPTVKFGELFDDEEVEQYYEALVGTLKSAKKRGYITFKGQMLLKGMHDNVLISIQENHI